MTGAELVIAVFDTSAQPPTLPPARTVPDPAAMVAHALPQQPRPTDLEQGDDEQSRGAGNEHGSRSASRWAKDAQGEEMNGAGRP